MIRPATAQDAPFLTALSFKSKRYWKYPEEYFAIWKNELTMGPDYIEKNDVFVYENDRPIIGYYSLVNLHNDMEAAGALIPKGVWLEHMFIDPPHIGQGIGAKLFNHLRERCLACGIREIGILSDPHSKGFYEKMGCAYQREYPSTIPGRTTPYLRYTIGKDFD